MRKSWLSIPGLILLIALQAAASEDNVFFGIGAGALYSGLGVNLAMRTDTLARTGSKTISR